MTTRRELDGHVWRKHLALPAPVIVVVRPQLVSAAIAPIR